MSHLYHTYLDFIQYILQSPLCFYSEVKGYERDGGSHELGSLAGHEPAAEPAEPVEPTMRTVVKRRKADFLSSCNHTYRGPTPTDLQAFNGIHPSPTKPKGGNRNPVGLVFLSLVPIAQIGWLQLLWLEAQTRHLIQTMHAWNTYIPGPSSWFGVICNTFSGFCGLLQAFCAFCTNQAGSEGATSRRYP